MLKSKMKKTIEALSQWFFCFKGLEGIILFREMSSSRSGLTKALALFYLNQPFFLNHKNMVIPMTNMANKAPK